MGENGLVSLDLLTLQTQQERYFSMKKIQKPAEGEYIPYAVAYIKLVPEEGFLLQYLRDNVQKVKDLIQPLPEEKLITPCEEGEWTIKEIMVHIIDTERIFAYRALRIARNDSTPLPGFEQNEFVNHAGANQRNIEDILEELTLVRMANIAMFNSFGDEVWERAGIASGHKLTVRAAAYIIAGHEQHHIDSIKENYLSAM